jgi:hypothetical protein
MLAIAARPVSLAETRNSSGGGSSRIHFYSRALNADNVDYVK